MSAALDGPLGARVAFNVVDTKSNHLQKAGSSDSGRYAPPPPI